MKNKNVLEDISTSKDSLRKLSIMENKYIHGNAINRYDVLLQHRLYTIQQKRIKHQIRLGIKSNESYKFINADFRERMHIENPPDDVRTVTSIHKCYFKYLNQHPRTQIVPQFQTLRYQFHDLFRHTQEIAYRSDCMLVIQQHHQKVLQQYESSMKKYVLQVNQFDEFISQDYENSKACLKKSLDLEAKVIDKQSEIECMANEQFLIRSRLVGLDYKYFVQQKYGRFLYYLSPPSWRAAHRDFACSVEIEAKGFDLGVSGDDDPFIVIFKKIQTECSCGLVKPALYFSKPDELMIILESINKLESYHFSRSQENEVLIKTVTNILKSLRSGVEQETTFGPVIVKITERISYIEKRIDYLQDQFMKILNGLFYNTVATTEVLKLYIHLEYSFEKVFSRCDKSLSILSLAKYLEDMYMNYSLKLEDLSSNNIEKAAKESMKSEEFKIKRAYKAARELRMFDRLEQKLRNADTRAIPKKAAPLKNVTSVPVVKRSPKKSQRQSPIRHKENSHLELTDAELEYLALFTDWSEHENPTDYLLCKHGDSHLCSTSDSCTVALA